MLGVSGPQERELPEDILKVRLAGMAYLPQGPSQPLSPSLEREGRESCPAFIRTAFKNNLSEGHEWQIKELLLICNRYSLLCPGELFPELYKLFHPDSRLQRQLLLSLKPNLLFLSDHFEDFRHFTKEMDPEWGDWAPLQRKSYLLSRFAWGKSLQSLDKIKELPSGERADLLETLIYYEWPERLSLANQLSASRSEKANAWANAYLLKDPAQPLYQKALSFIKENFRYENDAFHLNTNATLPFPLACPDILDDNAAPVIWLLGWVDPDTTFSYMDIDLQKFSDQLTDLDNKSSIVGAILHAAVYHNNLKWVEYGLEMVRYYHLQELIDHEKWPRLLKRIPAALIISVFQKSMDKAVSDLDRLDALYEWLYPADIFLSKEVTEKAWPLIVSGTELMETGGLPLDKFREFFNWVCSRIYPGFPIHWNIQKQDQGIFADLQKAVNRRYHFYKSLNEWLKRNQHS